MISTRPARLISGTALAVAAGLLSACGSSSGAADGEEVTTLRYLGSTGLINYAELADALGYLDGLTLEKVGEAQGGPESLQALATGQVEFAGGPFNGAIAKVASTGIELKAVIAGYGKTKENNSSVVTLEDSPISSGRDLIGKKVAVNTLGANSEAFVDTYLDAEGLTADEIDKVTLVPLPPLNTESALREKQVDAALLSFASKNLALEHGGIRILASDTDFVGDYNGGSYVLLDEFIEENPETTAALVAGLSKAIEYEQSHTVEETLEVYTAYLEEKGRGEEAKAYELWEGNAVATPGGVLRDEDFTLWLKWLEKSGEVEPDAVDIEQLYTNEFNPAAE